MFWGVGPFCLVSSGSVVAFGALGVALSLLATPPPPPVHVEDGPAPDAASSGEGQPPKPQPMPKVEKVKGGHIVDGRFVRHRSGTTEPPHVWPEHWIGVPFMGGDAKIVHKFIFLDSS